MNNAEIIKQLEEVSSLLERRCEIYNRNTVRRAYEKAERMKKKIPPLPDVPAGIEKLPVWGAKTKKEAKKVTFDFKKIDIKTLDKKFLVSLGIVVVSYILSSITNIALFGVAFLLAIIASVYFGIPIYKEYSATKKKADVEGAFYAELSEALSKFESEKAKGFESAKAYAENVYRKEYSKIKKVLEDMENEDKKELSEISEILVELEKYEFVSEEHRELVPNILLIMKTGRANSYQEALNLAIKEKREDEIEEARREEEARKIAIMEQQQREESYARYKAEQDARFKEYREKEQHKENLRAARSRCARCRKRGSCGAAAGNNPHCGAFEPY